jgi:hypothetical protein
MAGRNCGIRLARLTDLTRGSMLGYLVGGGEPAAALGGETRQIVGAVGASATLGQVEGEAEVPVETGIIVDADTSGRVGGRNCFTNSSHRVYSNAAPVG